MRCWVALVLVLSLAGCYRSHQRVEPENDASVEPEPAGPLAAFLASAWCEAAATCPSGLGRGFITLDPLARVSVELCMTHGAIALETRALAAAWEEAIERGDARLDERAMAGCLDAIREQPCFVERVLPSARIGFRGLPPFRTGAPGLLGFDPRCDAMFVRAPGRLPVGASCAGPLDCEEGAYCGRKVEGGVCRQHCIAYARPGDACEVGFGSHMCQPGALRCIDDVCVSVPRSRRAPLGERCGVLPTDGGLVDERCAPPAHCGAGREDELRCMSADQTEGGQCTTSELPDLICAPPLTCGPRGAGPGVFTCHASQLTRDEGALCDDDVAIPRQWRVCDPRAGLVCSDGSCRRASDGSLGASCGDTEPCAPELRCVDDQCVAPLPDGAPCAPFHDDACESGYCGPSRTCEPCH